jgi:hypothetical protein
MMALSRGKTGPWTKVLLAVLGAVVALAIGQALPSEAQADGHDLYDLTVKNLTPEGGKVTGEGIDCGTDCRAEQVRNEPRGCDELSCAWSYSIELTAPPAPGYVLESWDGCGAGAWGNSCYVYSDEPDYPDQTVSVQFRKAECSDGSDNDQDGSVDHPDAKDGSDTPPDPDCESPSDDSETYQPPPDTTPPNLTVTPESIGRTNDNTPTVEFSSTEEGVTFRCSVYADQPFYEPVPGYRYNNYTDDNCKSTFTTPPLPEGDAFIVVTAKDAAGNVSQMERRSLTADTQGPTVAWVYPAADDTSADPRYVSVAFAEPVDRASAEAAFSLAPTGDTDAKVSGSFSWDGTTMTFDPSGNLAPQTSYRATVASGVRDDLGNESTAEKSWTFTTRARFRETFTLSKTGIFSGRLRAGDYSRLGADDNSYYQVNSTTSGSTRVTDWYGDFYDVSDDASDLKITYKGKNSATCSQRLYVYRFDGTRGWAQLDSRSVGTSEVLLADRTPSGNPADYVEDPWGTVRVRVRCTRSSGFYASGDLMRLSFERP